MITYKDWFIFLGVARLILGQPVFALEFSISKPSIQVGEPALLTLKLPKSSPSDRAELFDDFLTTHKELKLLEQHARHQDQFFEWTFEFTSHKPGNYQIPPLQVKVGPNTYSTTALPLLVTTSREVEDTQIRPEQGVLSPPFPWKKVFNITIWLICAIVVLWLLNRIVRRVSWRAIKQFRIRISLPNLETNRMWLRKELNKIRQELASGNTSAALVDKIIYTLRLFLLRQTHFPTTAWTSKEITHQLPAPLLKGELKTIFLHSDHLQFAEIQKDNAKAVAEELLDRIEREYLK